MTEKAKLLVSACLLGSKTRYDASHKLCSVLQEPAFSQFELVAICPEVEIGLGIPRTPINLHQRNHQIEIIVEDENKTNISQAMRQFCKNFTRELNNYHGIILKKNSPSCGIAQVSVIQPDQSINKNGIGEFAYHIQRYFAQHHLEIPIIDEQDLLDPLLKQLFIRRANALYRS